MTTNGAICDSQWGCDHYDLADLAVDNICACRVCIADVAKLAGELTKTVVDTSWMSHLDKGAKRSYERTVADTVSILVDIFKSVAAVSPIAEDFGEVMVSMGSARALKMIFSHSEVPLAELWKPQVKQNEGFDFHTVCPDGWLHFGEAKYSSTTSPHGVALNQIADFLEAEKHYRDRQHLVSIVPPDAVNKLDNEEFGVVAAFSLNAVNPERVLKNAVKSAQELAKKHKLVKIYLVGVSNDA